MAQNPEFMAAIGKSFDSQTATLSKMMETEEEEEGFTYECSSCNLVQTEENMSYSDNTCPHCGSTMYRNINLTENMRYSDNTCSHCGSTMYRNRS